LSLRLDGIGRWKAASSRRTPRRASRAKDFAIRNPQLSHAYCLVAAVNVDDLASDRRGSVAGEENSGGAQLS